VEWVEVSLSVEAETAEAVSEVLSRYAHNGVAIEAGPDGLASESVVVRAYLPADDRLPGTRRRVREALWHLGQIRPIPEPAFRTIADADWTKVWRETLQVLHIGKHVVVRPSWRDYVPEPGDIVIQLDPGQAFGTGLHPTTQLCLSALELLVAPGVDVLDLGTGSGILAIAAAKLGAGHVLAIDEDPVAVAAARANSAANQVEDRIIVVQGSLADAPGTYDVVVVNILLGVITRMLREGLAARLRPTGRLMLAGILANQEEQIMKAARPEGLALVRKSVSGEWVGLALSPA
jgi:ribosomal protein L11 methyltransferase